MTRSAHTSGSLRQFLSGVRMLGAGFGVWRTAPALMMLGLLPAVIVAIAFGFGVVALGLNL